MSTGNNGAIQFTDVKPWPDPVEGPQLLTEIAEWLELYLYLPEGAADALSVWIVTTWFIEEVYFAPILTVLSPTKRSGKSNLLDLVGRLVLRGHSTSGIGVTPAVLFRLNDEHHPTLLIDEAEKLKSQKGGSDLIGLLNAGYRKGGQVQRCRDRASGGFYIENFDAFGFRVLALIGNPWDTLLDRSIVIPMQRKPREVNVKLIQAADLVEAGQQIGSRIARFADDRRDSFARALEDSPRPWWLNDRQCDNWAGPFAIAQLAGGDWPDRALRAARLLSPAPGEDGDQGERLIHDIRDVFADNGNPEAMMSGSLVEILKEIETSPWTDCRGGRGLSPNQLAKLLKPFRVGPRQARTEDGTVVRGYWLTDLRPVFVRYPSPVELVQVVQTSDEHAALTFSTSPAVPHVPPSHPQVGGGDECSL